MNMPLPIKLTWVKCRGYEEAQLGTQEDGIRFSIQHLPSCYRRGPYRLLVEVCGGVNHIKWGCFDDQDQPMRYYHSETNAKEEADLIANVLWIDRQKAGGVPS